MPVLPSGKNTGSNSIIVIFYMCLCVNYSFKLANIMYVSLKKKIASEKHCWNIAKIGPKKVAIVERNGMANRFCQTVWVVKLIDWLLTLQMMHGFTKKVT